MKAIHSYEQGWRTIPGHVQRQLIFLLYRRQGGAAKRAPCWVVKHCPKKRKEKCPAWEFKAGHICWFINGTICAGEAQKNWEEKMKICNTCEVLAQIIDE